MELPSLSQFTMYWHSEVLLEIAGGSSSALLLLCCTIVQSVITFLSENQTRTQEVGAEEVSEFNSWAKHWQKNVWFCGHLTIWHQRARRVHPISLVLHQHRIIDWNTRPLSSPTSGDTMGMLINTLIQTRQHTANTLYIANLLSVLKTFSHYVRWRCRFGSKILLFNFYKASLFIWKYLSIHIVMILFGHRLYEY